MTTYQSTETIHVPAKTLFAYLADVENLPQYFPRLTSAHRVDGDRILTTATIEHDGKPRQVEGQAWVTIEKADQILTWGSPGPNNYKGHLDLDPIDANSCQATIRITTTRKSEHMQHSLDATLQAIKHAAEQPHA